MSTLGLFIATACSNDQTLYQQAGTKTTPVNQVLESAVSNNTVTLPASPWGSNAQVTVGIPYFAASGQTCRTVKIITAAGRNEQQVACKKTNSDWAFSRQVTRLDP